MNSYIILSGLIVLIVLSPIAVGSVYIVTYSAIEIIVFGLLLLHIWTSDFSSLARERIKDQGLRGKVDPESIIRNPESSRHFPIRDSRSEIITDNYPRNTLLLMLPMFLFLAFVLFQLIPLPLSLIHAISPQTAAFYEKMSSPLASHLSLLTSVQFNPLTLSI